MPALDQVVELPEVDRRLGGPLPRVPVRLDVAADDGRRELHRAHRRARGQVAEDQVVGPAVARLDLFGADGDLGVIADLVGDLEHGHEAGVHADEVHLPPEPPVGVLEHALQLPVVEAVGLTRFDFVGTRWL